MDIFLVIVKLNLSLTSREIKDQVGGPRDRHHQIAFDRGDSNLSSGNIFENFPFFTSLSILDFSSLFPYCQ